MVQFFNSNQAPCVSTKPFGGVRLSSTDLSCDAGRLVGNQHKACLSEPVSALSGDSGNPPGTWLVDGKLRDANRALEWQMCSSFKLKAGE